MSDQIKQIAERLQGLRDVLELTPDEVAKSCQLSVEEYLGMESGEKDAVLLRRRFGYHFCSARGFFNLRHKGGVNVCFVFPGKFFREEDRRAYISFGSLCDLCTL